jgi:ATP synthase protein I
VEDSTKKARWGLGNSYKAFRTAGPLFGSGIQLAAAVVVFLFIGRWLDGALGTDPWLMLTGALLGAAGGLYRFIRTALKAGDEEASGGSDTRDSED